MIRILQVVTYMNRGGLETMLMNYYRNMDRTKVQFDFLVHREKRADYDDEIEELGGRIYHLPRLNPFSISYKRSLQKFFQSHPEYQVIHVHQDCMSSIILKEAKNQGIKVRIAHSHSSNQDKNWKYIIKKYYMRRIPRYATGLLACGKMAGNWMFAGYKYGIVRNAIDLHKYTYKEKLEKEVRKEWQLEDEMVIGHVGRFNTVKNHDFLIDIFAECVRKKENIRLLLVGDGEEKQKIEEKVKQMGLEKKVIFTGVRSDVERLMQIMNVFVFPSFYEGLPVTMVEAQAAGLPCVISDHVSEECIITENLVTEVSLDEKPEKWADIILKSAEIEKKNRSEEIRKAGYDICKEAKKMQKFYIHCAERE